MLPHTYDDALHLRRMVSIAKSLAAVPPISAIRMGSVDGGQLVYGGKTAALVTQTSDDVKLRFSTDESFDIQGLPITVKVSQLYGTPDAKIRELKKHEFEITVPFRSDMPKGRSSFAVIANNGQSDGNPAIITVNRSLGLLNRRPKFNVPDEITIVPGQKNEYEIDVTDPEGFEVTLAKHLQTPGELEGKRFIWNCPAGHPTGDFPMTVIASDGCTGSSYSAIQLPLKVQTTIAKLVSDRSEGSVPLTVNFSSADSRDTKAGVVTFHWDFGDGHTSKEPNPTHTFNSAGYHEVRLTVSAGTEVATKTTVINARHNWNKVIDNGWGTKGVFSHVWNVDPDLMAKPSKFGRHKSLQVLVKKRSAIRKPIESKAKIKTPCFVDAEFYRANQVRGSGIEILGAVLGRGVGADGETFSDGFSFSDQRDQFFISDFPAIPANLARLRVYVTPDPNHAGRFVFSGYLNCDGDEVFFRFDNRELANHRVAILGGEWGSQHFTRFQVWTSQ